MKFKKIFPWLLLIPVLLLVAFLLLIPKSGPTRPSVKLASGTTITLEEVTYGKSHSFLYGKPYQKSLYRMLPARFKSWSGTIVNNYAAANTNDPIFWLAFKSEQPFQYSAVTVLDEYGSELNSNGSSMGMAASQRSRNSTVYIAHYQLDTQSPHGRIVGICFYSDHTKTQKLALLMIPGASLASMPATNTSLPVVKSAGEITVELISLTTGLKSVPDYFSRATNKFFTQARFRLTNKSGPMRGWAAENFKIIGNDGESSRVAKRDGFIGDDIIVNFDRNLDSSVPCKFEIEFAKYSGFSNEDKITLKAIPFPSNGEVSTLNLITNMHERTITIKSIRAANSPGPSYPFQPAQPVIEVNLAPVSSKDNFLLIDAINQDGGQMSQGGYSQKGRGGYLFGFQNGVFAKTVDLTFALQRNLSFEFQATPVSFPSTNSSTTK